MDRGERLRQTSYNEEEKGQMTKTPYVGMRIRIKPNSTLFPGKEAAVAYIGTEGISVYLVDSDFDECIPLNNDEWEPI